MKEDFLHYIWQFKKFNLHNLKTTKGDKIEVISTGQYLQQAGPDFFNASLIIGGQKWAGNVEIHIKSSDWYVHNHEKDKAYDSVILHVVWEHDTEVFRQDNTEMPVVQLKDYVVEDVLNNYRSLTVAKTWIYCEKELKTLNSFVLENWKERLFLERLERKAIPVLALAQQVSNDWEAVLFCFLAKNFGLNINGEAFFEIAKSLPFSIIRKESFEAENLEALFFGRAGLLNEEFEDMYFKNLKMRYEYMCHKYQLDHVFINELQFFKLRPDNFPTIRLSQLAHLYSTYQNIFSKIITASTTQQLYNVFSVHAGVYWQTHYRFDKESSKKRKALSKSFMDLLIINTVVPFLFAYNKYLGKDNCEDIIAMLKQINAEKNTVIDKFNYYKVPVDSAYDSQSLLQLKNNYCDNKKCMQCALGIELLKKT